MSAAKVCGRCGGTGRRTVGAFEALRDEFDERRVWADWSRVWLRVGPDHAVLGGVVEVQPLRGGPIIGLDTGEHHGPNAEADFAAEVRALVAKIGGWDALWTRA